MEMNAHDERISSFLDDAMPAAERATFESELLDNAELRQQVIELRQLRQDVALLPRFSVTEGFAQRVVAAAVAAKANENANITPASRPKPKTVRRLTIGGLAIAASVAIMVGTISYINNRPAMVAVKPAEAKPLAAVMASLPNQTEAFVLRIESPKDAKAGEVLRVALAEQGIVQLRSSKQAAFVGNVYRKHLTDITGNDRSKQVAPAAAMYLEITPAELELALERLADPKSGVKFVPENRLALVPQVIPDPANPQATAAGEMPAEIAPQANAAEFMQELNPANFRLLKDKTTPTVVAPQSAAPPTGKVRVLILIEDVE